ncbi:MAG: SDR family NAD(P)-dependent oxidoreductase [Myxococcota bacterium]
MTIPALSRSRSVTRRRRFQAQYGPWALVAGGAEGLGATTARALAQRGLHVWLVDRNTHALAATAAQIGDEFAVDVATQVVDLAEPDAAEKIIDARAGREVGILAYVAAAAPIGPFVDRARKDQLDALAVNCQTPTALLHALLPAMIARGRGGALLFSSMAGFQGSARIATYAATKAFDLVLAESLAAELRPKGIDIAAVCPGPTATPGYHRSKPQSRPAPVMQPDLVVAEALDLFGRRTVIVPGRFNRWSRRLLRWIGRQRAVELVSRATERMYPSSRTWPDEK